MEHQLVISFSPEKGVQVTGPINDKILAYGMLEAARDAIQDYQAKAASEKRIVTPRFQFDTNGNQLGE